MLHEGIGTEGKTLFLLSLRIEADEVAGNVLDLLFRAFLEFLPCPCPQSGDTGRLAFFSLVFRNLMKRMDRHVNGIVILIGQFDHFLHLTVRGWHADQSCEAPHAVVHMNDVVTRFKLHKLLQRESHLCIAGMIGLEIVFMESIEYLMVCQATDVQILIGKSLVKCTFHGLKAHPAMHLSEDIGQALRLFRTVGQNVDGIAVGHILEKRGLQKVKLLMEEGLQMSVEVQHGRWCAKRLRADIETLERSHTAKESFTCDEK